MKLRDPIPQWDEPKLPYKLLNSSEDDAAFNKRSVLSDGTVAARDLRARLHFFDVRT